MLHTFTICDLAISQEPIRKTLPKLLTLDVIDVHNLLKETLA